MSHGQQRGAVGERSSVCCSACSRSVAIHCENGMHEPILAPYGSNPCQSLLGLCLDCVWIVFGQRLDCVRIVFGLCLDCVWIVSGLRLDCVWIAFGLCLDCVWTAFGLCLDCVWIAFGMCWGCVLCGGYICREGLAFGPYSARCVSCIVQDGVVVVFDDACMHGLPFHQRRGVLPPQGAHGLRLCTHGDTAPIQWASSTMGHASWMAAVRRRRPCWQGGLTHPRAADDVGISLTPLIVVGSGTIVLMGLETCRTPASASFGLRHHHPHGHRDLPGGLRHHRPHGHRDRPGGPRHPRPHGPRDLPGGSGTLVLMGIEICQMLLLHVGSGTIVLMGIEIC